MKPIFFLTFLSITIVPFAQDNSIVVKKDIGENFFEAAKKYIGVPFIWGGRSRKKLDCMGLLFLAYSDVTGKPWRNLSVLPSELVKSGNLGKPVPGLDGVLSDSLKNIKLKKGDILYFLSSEKVYETDIPLVRIDSIPYWVWHMGIYAGGEEKPMILHACPSDRVKIEPLENIYFDAIFVTRFGVTDSVEKLCDNMAKGVQQLNSNCKHLLIIMEKCAEWNN
ncbi:MAG: C40 family peptidase [Candidatus Helarchaeota archaeon]